MANDAAATHVNRTGRTSDPSFLESKNALILRAIGILGLLFTNLVFSSTSAAATETAAAAAFRAGVAEFKAQHYSRALDEFQHARTAGMTTSALRFNLGVTLYRLERYAEARNEFTVLTNDPIRAPVAHYNLGLVALKTGHTDEARSAFERAYQLARDQRIESLSVQQLHKLGTSPPERSRWRGFVDLGAGYDDNVSLTSSSSLLTTSRAGSAALSVFASGSGRITGDFRNGFDITGSVYHIEYPSATAFSQNYLRVTAPYRFRRGLWSGSAGVQGSYLTLGGRSFETIGGATAEVRRALSEQSAMQLSYRFDQISGGSSYAYVSGRRQSLDLEYDWSVAALRATAGYRFEYNQRDDLSRGAQFFSASPTRQRIYGHLVWAITEQTNLRLNGSYQVSRYHDPNVFTVATIPSIITRSDNLYSVELKVGYRLSDSWTLLGGYRFLKNASNIPAYQYSSNLFTINCEARFP